MDKIISNQGQATKQNKRFRIFQATLLSSLIYLVFDSIMKFVSMWKLYSAGNYTIDNLDFLREIQTSPYPFISDLSIVILGLIFAVVGLIEVIFMCMWVHGAFYTSKHFFDKKKANPTLSVIGIFIPIYSIIKFPTDLNTLLEDYTQNKQMLEFNSYWAITLIIFFVTIVSVLPFSNNILFYITLQTILIILGFVRQVLLYIIIKNINEGILKKLNTNIESDI